MVEEQETPEKSFHLIWLAGVVIAVMVLVILFQQTGVAPEPEVGVEEPGLPQTAPHHPELQEGIQEAPDQFRDYGEGPFSRPPGTAPADPRRPATVPYEHRGLTPQPEDREADEIFDDGGRTQWQGPEESEAEEEPGEERDYLRASPGEARENSIRSVPAYEPDEEAWQEEEGEEVVEVVEVDEVDEWGEWGEEDGLEEEALAAEYEEDRHFDERESFDEEDQFSEERRTFQGGGAGATAESQDTWQSSAPPVEQVEQEWSDEEKSHAREAARESFHDYQDYLDEAGVPEPDEADAFSASASAHVADAMDWLTAAMAGGGAHPVWMDRDLAEPTFDDDEGYEESYDEAEETVESEEESFDEDAPSVWVDMADWLRDIQEAGFPDHVDLVDRVEEAALAIDPDLPESEQIEELMTFYEAMEEALEIFVDDSGEVLRPGI